MLSSRESCPDPVAPGNMYLSGIHIRQITVHFSAITVRRFSSKQNQMQVTIYYAFNYIRYALNICEELHVRLDLAASYLRQDNS